MVKVIGWVRELGARWAFAYMAAQMQVRARHELDGSEVRAAELAAIARGGVL